MDAINYSQMALALVEGVGLILSPCILPILPIMLAASLDGGKSRPFGIIAGFIFAFSVFALAARQVLASLDMDPEIVRNASLLLLVIFGAVMFSERISEKLISVTQGVANVGQSLTSRFDQKSGFTGGFLIGCLIGLIWTPCAGPIMAAAIVQIVQAKTSIDAIGTVVMFALGAGIPMLMITLAGRQVIAKIGFLKKNSRAIRRGMAVIIMVMAVMIYKGLDVALLTGLNTVNTVADKAAAIPAAASDVDIVPHLLPQPYPAPDFAGLSAWINSNPQAVADLKGKVVLIDFWTYSCINCVRTLPYLKSWWEKYRDQGFVIIGIHSPEFSFEKKFENVKAAAERFGLTYPIALDNELQTWANYKNQYWPAHYLIDRDGQVVYQHFGEGNYDITENVIRSKLGLKQGSVKQPIEAEANPYSDSQTPETYLGYARGTSLVKTKPMVYDTPADFGFPTELPPNHFALNGEWQSMPEYVEATKAGAALRINFQARKVFLVLAPASSNAVKLRVSLNGQGIGAAGGKDVKDSVVTVDRDRLYELVDQSSVKTGILELTAESPGIRAYAFTFGS